MAMMQAQGIGQDSPINKLAMSIAQRAMASDDPAGVLAHYKSMPDAKLAAFLADGLVQTQLAASHNQQAIQNYNPQQPSVLDRLTQAQGVVNLPVSQQMFDPAMHQEGIAAGAGEAPEQGMAGGGIVAFAGRGPSRVSAADGEPGIGMDDVIDEITREKKVAELRARADAALGRNAPTPPTPQTITPNDVAMRRAIEQNQARAAAARAPVPAPAAQAAQAAQVAQNAAQTATQAAQAAQAAPAPAPAQPAASASPSPGDARVDAARQAQANARNIRNAARVQGLDTFTDYIKRIPFAKAIPSALKSLGGLGLAGSVGVPLAMEATNAGIDAFMDNPEEFRDAVSSQPMFQSAAAERAGTLANQPVSQAEIDRYRAAKIANANKPVENTEQVSDLYGTLNRLRRSESNDDPNAVNPLSGATGRGQMIEATFNALKKKYPELKDAKWSDYKGNSQLQDKFEKALIKDVQQTFKGLNVPETLTNYAAAWFGGPKLVTAKGDQKIETVFNKKEIEQNPWVEGLTVDQVRDRVVSRVMGNRGTSATAAAPRSRSNTEIAREFVTQAPAAVAETVGGENAQGVVPATTQEWKDYLKNRVSTRENAAQGLNISRMGAANAMEAVFGLPGERKPADTAAAPTTAPAAAPTGPTAYEQYAEKRLQDAAAAGASKQELRDLGLALMMAGAKTLSGKSQYAAQNIGEGLESGIAGYVGLQQKRADTAAKSQEKAMDRAEKMYRDAITEEVAILKNTLPTGTDADTIRAQAHRAVVNRLPPSVQRLLGMDASYMASLQPAQTGARAKPLSAFEKP